MGLRQNVCEFPCILVFFMLLCVLYFFFIFISFSRDIATYRDRMNLKDKLFVWSSLVVVVLVLVCVVVVVMRCDMLFEEWNNRYGDGVDCVYGVAGVCLPYMRYIKLMHAQFVGIFGSDIRNKQATKAFLYLTKFDIGLAHLVARLPAKSPNEIYVQNLVFCHAIQFSFSLSL